MGIMSTLFGGGGGGKHFIGTEEWRAANKKLSDRVGGAIDQSKTPQQSAYGPKGPNVGADNRAFSDPYKQFKFQQPNLQSKTGAFGQLLGRTGTEFGRQARGTADAATRNMMRSGSYSPAAMKNLLLGSQKTAQEGLEGMGEKAAVDIGSEEARLNLDTQKEQARQGELSKEFAQKGGALAQEGKTAQAELQLKDLMQNKDFFRQLLELYGNQQTLPYTPKGGSSGGGGGIAGRILGGAAAGAMSLI